MLLGLESCGQLGLRPLRPFTDGNDWWVVQRGRLAPIMFSVNYHACRKKTAKIAADTRAESFPRGGDLFRVYVKPYTVPRITHRASFADAVTEFPRWTQPKTGVIKAHD